MERALSTRETGETVVALDGVELQHIALLEHLPGTLVTVVDLDRRVIYSSRSIETIGWQRDDVVGKTVDEIVPRDSSLHEMYAAALAGEQRSMDYQSVHGRSLWLQVVPLRSAAGQVVGAMSIGQDVTDRNTIERQLREAKEEFESAFQASAFGMALTDFEGRWLKVNKSACDLLGYDEDELLAIDFQSITHPSDLDENLTVRKRLLAGEIDSYQMEKRYIRKDGVIVPVLISVSVVRDENGDVLRCVSQIQDRTSDLRRRELETELAERRRADSLNVLAGGVAHDFNNLLVGILGHTSMALGETPPGSAVRRHLEQVEVSARAAAAVTDQMLAFSGNAWRELVDVDLGEHASELHKRFRGTVDGVTVRLSAPLELPNVRADPGQLQRITSNLMDNALEAIGAEGGTISISTGVLHLSRLTLDSYAVGGDAAPGLFVYLDVADDGHGMSEETRARMFEPFFSTKFQGRGLGLAAVDGLVRGHRGAIAVQSAVETGTRVRVLLPAAA